MCPIHVMLGIFQVSTLSHLTCVLLDWQECLASQRLGLPCRDRLGKWGDRDLVQLNTEKGKVLLGAVTAPTPVCAEPPSLESSLAEKALRVL